MLMSSGLFSLSGETNHMRRHIGIAALLLFASVANAQDTNAVVVRHIAAQQDTGVVVRHIAPAPAPSQPRNQAARYAPPYGPPRYALRPTTIIAKDPSVGSMLSFVFPGGGQYYAGANGKGLAITLIGIGAPIIGFSNVDRKSDYYYGSFPPPSGGNCSPNPSGYCRGRTDWTPAAIGLGVGITAWLYGIATAGTDVQRWNQAHGVRFVTAPGRFGFAVPVP